MRKIFIVAGEASGDILGAWYLRRLKQKENDIVCFAVGGDALEAAGAKIYARIEQLSVVGVVEVLKRLSFLKRFFSNVVEYLLGRDFDEIIFVDFPGFNLRLARVLKQRNITAALTYFSPPQLWVWGAWRIKTLTRYLDSVVVIYPFEVDWYRRHGLIVRWIGCPFYENVKPFLTDTDKKEQKIALLPGSRLSELERFLPFFGSVFRHLSALYPSFRFLLCGASTFSRDQIYAMLQKIGLANESRLELITDEHEKYRQLASCCCAIGKPGIGTLELALLQVPTVVMFKTSWLTYCIARPFVRVTSMTLPNLLLEKPLFTEVLQTNVRPEVVVGHVNRLLNDFSCNKQAYQQLLDQLLKLRDLLQYDKPQLL